MFPVSVMIPKYWNYKPILLKSSFTQHETTDTTLKLLQPAKEAEHPFEDHFPTRIVELSKTCIVNSPHVGWLNRNYPSWSLDLEDIWELASAIPSPPTIIDPFNHHFS